MAVTDKRFSSHQLACPDGGNAIVSQYTLFDGVSFLSADFHASTVAKGRTLRSSADVLLILHCQLGTLRMLQGDSVLIELHVGQTAVVHLDERNLVFELPESVYQGTCLRLSLKALTLSSRHGMSEFGVDFAGLLEQYEFGSAHLIDASIDFPHTFSEIANLMQTQQPHIGYLRLIAFEVLVLLETTGTQLDAQQQNAKFETAATESLYMDRLQIAYRAQQVMTRRLANPIGVEALARACEVSPTVLKAAFRQTFGVPVGSGIARTVCVEHVIYYAMSDCQFHALLMRSDM